jgi:large subunit ribosomal protein L24
MARAVAPHVTKVPEIRKGDIVLLMSGKDAGKRGTISRIVRPADPALPARVVVEGLNISKRATKPRQKMNMNDRVPQMQQGGMIDKPMPMAIGKVMLVCPHCDRPTRIRHLESSTGTRQRACARCGQPVEVKGS